MRAAGGVPHLHLQRIARRGQGQIGFFLTNHRLALEHLALFGGGRLDPQIEGLRGLLAVGCIGHGQPQHVRTSGQSAVEGEQPRLVIVAPLSATEVDHLVDFQPGHRVHLGSMRRQFQDRRVPGAVLAVIFHQAQQVPQFDVDQQLTAGDEIATAGRFVDTKTLNRRAEDRLANLDLRAALQFQHGLRQLGGRLGGPFFRRGNRLDIEVIGQTPKQVLPELLVNRIDRGNGLHRQLVAAPHQVEHPQRDMLRDELIPFALRPRRNQLPRIVLGQFNQLGQDVARCCGGFGFRRTAAGFGRQRCG